MTPPPAPSTSFINACSDFTSGPAAWPYVLTATTIADGAASQGAQTFTMNVVSLPAGGANFRVFKTTANGSSFFGPVTALTLGSNSVTVAAVSFDRAVKFQFSSGDVEFDALSVNGVNSTCIPAPAVPGCTDPAATNYDPNATTDDGSCTYPSTCNASAVTGVFVDQIIHNRATFNWDNMNSSTCAVDQMVIRYREVGTSGWTQKFLGNPVGSTTYYGTSKRVINLTPSTTYEYQFKIWYVGVSSPVNWGANPSGTFTTLDECPNVGNFAVSTPLTTRATFTWDDSNGAYSFVRIKLRVDSISNPSASDWQNAGGFGINCTWTRNKNGLTPGETYRGQSKTWCDPAGGPYKASSWTPLVFWTQPTSIRLDGESVIANLDVYPNPSRDIFNVSFTSEEAQDLDVRVINVVGEAVYTENLEEFIGEYTKQIDLANYTKGVYFLEITTNNGVVNKKLILQ